MARKNNGNSPRTSAQRERDIELETELYLRGYTYLQISATLAERDPPDNYSISAASIGRDLAQVRKKWQEQSLHHMTEQKNKELAKLDLIEREAWEAWERSCNPSWAKQENKRVNKNTGAMDTTSRIDITRSEVGDPRFLQIMQKCSEQRCRLLGLEKTINVNNTQIQAIMVGGQRIEF